MCRSVSIRKKPWETTPPGQSLRPGGKTWVLARVPGPRSRHPTFTGFLRKPLGNPQPPSRASDPDVAARRQWKQLRGAGGGDKRGCAQITTLRPPQPHTRRRPNCQPRRKRKTGSGGCGGGRPAAVPGSQAPCAPSPLPGAPQSRRAPRRWSPVPCREP